MPALAEQARSIAVPCHERTIERAERWIAHLENRLAYERAMLGESGGIATDKVKPEKGGACKCWASPGHGRGWSIIQKVNRALPDTPIVAVEINGQLAEALQRRFTGAEVHRGDFLSMNGELGTFDRIVMNPPFDHGSDLEHIRRAFAKLKTGGRLVAICANGPRQVEELGEISTSWETLPSGWCPGTGVNAAIVVLDN
jgi:hypothetical protein